MKSFKINKAVIKETDGKLTISNEEENFDLLDEIKKFKDIEFVNFKLGKARNSSGGGEKEKAKKYTYSCSCGNQIKSKSKDMQIKCLKCGEIFKIEEE